MVLLLVFVYLFFSEPYWIHMDAGIACVVTAGCMPTNNGCLELNTITENRGTHAMVVMVTCLLCVKAAMDATLRPMIRLEMIYFHRNTAKQTQPLVINTLGKGDNA